jgi:hypothetical protein
MQIGPRFDEAVLLRGSPLAVNFSLYGHHAFR